MQTRVQEINGDTVLEVTGDEAVKTRYSEKTLLRRRQYYEAAIAKFRAGLEATNAALDQIYVEKDKAQ